MNQTQVTHLGTEKTALLRLKSWTKNKQKSQIIWEMGYNQLITFGASIDRVFGPK